MKNIENMIEWLNGQSIISLTICDLKLKNKIMKLSKKDSNVVIKAVNQDGSIYVKLPIDYLKISAPKKVNFTDIEDRKKRLS